MNFILRWLATAIAVGVAAWLVPGVEVSGSESWVAVALIGLILSLINISIKPIAQALSLPITCLTLGVFYLIVNTAMVYLTAWVAEGIFNIHLHIASFGSAFVASIVISIVSGLVNALLGNDDSD